METSATIWDYRKIGTKLTPVQTAYMNGNLDIARILVRYGAKEENKEEIIQLMFLEACSSGTVKKMESLLKKGAIINRKTNGKTPLILSLDGLAFNNTFFDRVNFLLDNGADVNIAAEDKYGSTTALHKVIEGNRHFVKNNNLGPRFKNFPEEFKKLLKKVINHKAYVSAQDTWGQTPLHIAAKNSDVYSTKLLIENNAKIMVRDDDGQTPLDVSKSGEVIKLLKDAGATEL